jgi:hypothetical protein
MVYTGFSPVLNIALYWPGGQLNSLSDSGIALFSEPGIAMLQY